TLLSPPTRDWVDYRALSRQILQTQRHRRRPNERTAGRDSRDLHQLRRPWPLPKCCRPHSSCARRSEQIVGPQSNAPRGPGPRLSTVKNNRREARPFRVSLTLPRQPRLCEQISRENSAEDLCSNSSLLGIVLEIALHRRECQQWPSNPR